METNFFTELQKLNLKEINIVVSFFEEDKTTVAILPKSRAKDKATNLIPLIFTEKTEDLDKYFFESINKPLKNTATFFNNIEKYENFKEVQKAETEQAKEEKKKIQKVEEKLQKIVDDKDFNANEDKSKVLKYCKELKELDAKNSLAKIWETKIIELGSPELF